MHKLCDYCFLIDLRVLSDIIYARSNTPYKGAEPAMNESSYCSISLSPFGGVSVLDFDLIGLLWYLIVVLICSSLIKYNGDHLFICLYAICISSSVKYLFWSFAHCLIRLFVFFLLSFKSSLYILVTFLYQIYLCQYFLLVSTCLHILFTVPFIEQKLLILMKCSLWSISWVMKYLYSLSKISWLYLCASVPGLIILFCQINSKSLVWLEINDNDLFKRLRVLQIENTATQEPRSDHFQPRW